MISSKKGNNQIKFEELEWKKEKYYGSEYTINEIDAELLNVTNLK